MVSQVPKQSSSFSLQIMGTRRKNNVNSKLDQVEYRERIDKRLVPDFLITSAITTRLSNVSLSQKCITSEFDGLPIP